MSKQPIVALKFILGITVSAFLLHLVFKNVEWRDFREKAKEVKYLWVVVSVCLSFPAYIARAYRWNILLRPPGYKLKTSETTLAVIVGYFANLALPRLGEVVRCGLLKRNHNVPMPVALGSVVTERMVDVVVLGICLITGFLIESDRLLTFLQASYKNLGIPFTFIIGGGIVGLIGCVGLVFFIRRRFRSKGTFAHLIKSFMDGILSLGKIDNILGFILSTLSIWVIYYLMSYVIVFSLPETSHLGFGAGWMLLVVGGVAIAIPVQSGFGTYHGMVSGMLLLYSIDHGTGVFLATLMHTSQVVSIALFGTLALIVSFFIKKRQEGDTHSEENKRSSIVHRAYS